MPCILTTRAESPVRGTAAIRPQSSLAEHLAQRVARQRVDEAHAPRPLVRRELARRVREQVVGARRWLAGRDDHRHHDLAPLVGRLAHHRDLGHRGVREQHVLDLARVHVEAAGDDQLLGAPDDAQVPVGVELADVAAAEPAVGGERARVASSRRSSSRGTRWARAAGSRPSRRHRVERAPPRRATGSRRSRRAARRRRDSTRSSASRSCRSARARARRPASSSSLVQRRGQRRRARHAQPERGELGDARATPPGARTWSAHRRRASRRARARRRAPRRRRTAGSSTADPPAQQRAVQPDAEPVDVEQRQRQHQPVALGPAPGQPQGLAAGQRVGVGEHGALRRAGGAGRVAEQRQVLGLARSSSSGSGPSGRSTAGVVTTHRRRRARSRSVAPRVGVDHRGRRRAVGDDVRDLAVPVRAVDRHDDEPEPQGGDVRDDEVVRRRRAHHDAVTGAEPGAARSAPATTRDRRSRSPRCASGPRRGWSDGRAPRPTGAPTPRAGCAARAGRPPRVDPGGEVASPGRVHRRGGYRARGRVGWPGWRARRPGACGHRPLLGPPARRDAPRRPPAGRGRAHRSAHRGAPRAGERCSSCSRWPATARWGVAVDRPTPAPDPRRRRGRGPGAQPAPALARRRARDRHPRGGRARDGLAGAAHQLEPRPPARPGPPRPAATPAPPPTPCRPPRAALAPAGRAGAAARPQAGDGGGQGPRRRPPPARPGRRAGPDRATQAPPRTPAAASPAPPGASGPPRAGTRAPPAGALRRVTGLLRPGGDGARVDSGGWVAFRRLRVDVRRGRWSRAAGGGRVAVGATLALGLGAALGAGLTVAPAAPAGAQQSLIDSDPAVIKARADLDAAQAAAHDAEAKLEATTEQHDAVVAEDRRRPDPDRRARRATRRPRAAARRAARPPAPARGRALRDGWRRHQRHRHLLRQRARRRPAQAARRRRHAQRPRQRGEAGAGARDAGGDADHAPEGAGRPRATAALSSTRSSPTSSSSRPRSTTASPRPTPRSSAPGRSARSMPPTTRSWDPTRSPPTRWSTGSTRRVIAPASTA